MKGEPLYELIYKEMLNSIRNGTYQQGVKLPSEKEICEQFNVSRITGKKAMDMLAEQNIIIRMPGKGSFVNAQCEQVITELAPNKGSAVPQIGVIMDGFGGSYGYKVVLGIEQTCREMGIMMNLHCTNGNAVEETRAIHQMLSIGVEGIIIMCVHGENFNSTVLKLAVENYPIVLLDRKLKGVPVPFVGTDNQQAARELNEWLLDRGHKSICFASHEDSETSTITERQAGFIDSFIKRGMVVSEDKWLTNLKATLPSFRNEASLQDDLTIISKYIKDNKDVTAFFAIEYDIAEIIQYALTKLGIEDKYDIVCFDGHDSIIGNSNFTHVCQAEFTIGKVCVETLQEKIKGKKIVESILVPYKIMESGADS